MELLQAVCRVARRYTRPNPPDMQPIWRCARSRDQRSMAAETSAGPEARAAAAPVAACLAPTLHSAPHSALRSAARSTRSSWLAPCAPRWTSRGPTMWPSTSWSPPRGAPASTTPRRRSTARCCRASWLPRAVWRHARRPWLTCAAAGSDASLPTRPTPSRPAPGHSGGHHASSHPAARPAVPDLPAAAGAAQRGRCGPAAAAGQVRGRAAPLGWLASSELGGAGGLAAHQLALAPVHHARAPTPRVQGSHPRQAGRCRRHRAACAGPADRL